MIADGTQQLRGVFLDPAICAQLARYAVERWLRLEWVCARPPRVHYYNPTGTDEENSPANFRQQRAVHDLQRKQWQKTAEELLGRAMPAVDTSALEDKKMFQPNPNKRQKVPFYGNAKAYRDTIIADLFPKEGAR